LFELIDTNIEYKLDSKEIEVFAGDVSNPSATPTQHFFVKKRGGVRVMPPEKRMPVLDYGPLRRDYSTRVIYMLSR